MSSADQNGMRWGLMARLTELQQKELSILKTLEKPGIRELTKRLLESELSVVQGRILVTLKQLDECNSGFAQGGVVQGNTEPPYPLSKTAYMLDAQGLPVECPEFNVDESAIEPNWSSRYGGPRRHRRRRNDA